MHAHTALQIIPGGKALIDWFGHVPRFHDAELLEIGLSSQGESHLRIHTWQMTDKVDINGHLILDKHVVVRISLIGVTHVDLSDFNMMPGIIFGLEITEAEGEYALTWDASYGVIGTIRARQVLISIQPGKP
jgi:hypothetical protein